MGFGFVGVPGDEESGLDELGHVDDQAAVEAIRSDMVGTIHLDRVSGLARDIFEVNRGVADPFPDSVFEHEVRGVDQVAGGVVFDEADLGVGRIAGKSIAVLVAGRKVKSSDFFVQVDPERIVIGQTSRGEQRDQFHKRLSTHLSWPGPLDVAILVLVGGEIEDLGRVTPSPGHGCITGLVLAADGIDKGFGTWKQKVGFERMMSGLGLMLNWLRGIITPADVDHCRTRDPSMQGFRPGLREN